MSKYVVDMCYAEFASKQRAQKHAKTIAARNEGVSIRVYSETKEGNVTTWKALDAYRSDSGKMVKINP